MSRFRLSLYLNTYPMNFDKALTQAISYLKANLVTALWGHPGVGKSALGQLIADAFELLFIDIRLGQIDPIDLNGFVHKYVDTGRFDYLPWARFPLEGDELPINPKTGRPYKGFLIMFDEVNTAPRQNLAAAYKIFLDRMVGMHKLHPQCRLMMGGNLVGEGLAGAMPSPLVSRVAHIVMDAELVPAHKQILGESIYNFLSNHRKFVYQEAKTPNTAFPTLRTWEMARKYIDANGADFTTEGLTGIVGMEAAVSYQSFRATERSLIDILNAPGAFPTESAQDLINFLKATDLDALEAHLPRFPAEWYTIAKADLESARAAAEAV